jgi:hypothetical protein
VKAAAEFAQQVAPMVLAMRQEGLSLRQIGAALADKGVRTARCGSWSADAVRQVILRANRDGAAQQCCCNGVDRVSYH